jgi:hypothetical protein
MALGRRRSSGDHTGQLDEDRWSYTPPTRRKRLIRVRWYAPIAIGLGIAGFVVFLLTGPDYNQRLTLELADGTTREICAVRTIVGDGGIEPLADGSVNGVPFHDRANWLDADPPSARRISTGGARVTYFDEDGRAFVPSDGEEWSSALVEPPGDSRWSYVAIEAHGRCYF